MYSWDSDPTTWRGSGTYKYSDASAALRDAAAERAKAEGPRTYKKERMPDLQRTDPKKKIVSHSKNPMIVAVDVTGSMAHWPFEIFDRLPLLYTTLCQYRDDLEVAFMAVGDEGADRWPLQVTSFARGFDLESQLKALHGEGGGGDFPESYGLLAWYVANRCVTPNATEPTLIVFGDATMHRLVNGANIKAILGVDPGGDQNAMKAWQDVARTWDVWFLRRPTGSKGDDTETQWGEAIGAKRVITIEDEDRAVDCAMGIVAEKWGCYDDFKENMLARQPAAKVERMTEWISRYGLASLKCPECSGAIPKSAYGRFTCSFCGTLLEL